MVRTETMVGKATSDLKTPKKISSGKYTRKELDDMTVKLANAHGML